MQIVEVDEAGVSAGVPSMVDQALQLEELSQDSAWRIRSELHETLRVPEVDVLRGFEATAL